MKFISYLKLLKENKQLKDEVVQQNRLINDLTEQVIEYKTRNTKLREKNKKLKEVEQ